jgi:hypothetical protein
MWYMVSELERFKYKIILLSLNIIYYNNFSKNYFFYSENHLTIVGIYYTQEIRNIIYPVVLWSAKCMSVELKVYLFIWSLNLRFSMSLSLSPNLLYRQTTDCTEGGGLTNNYRWIHSCQKVVVGSTNGGI